MGFLDKARAAANELAAKADTALAGSGMGGPGATRSSEADRYLRDFGVLAYLEANGRPASAEERDRILDALRGMESHGTIGNLSLQTAAPPPPGAAAATPPPPGASGPGASGPPQTAPPPPPPASGSGAQPSAPPPPPPSWMGKDE